MFNEREERVILELEIQKMRTRLENTTTTSLVLYPSEYTAQFRKGKHNTIQYQSVLEQGS